MRSRGWSFIGAPATPRGATSAPTRMRARCRRPCTTCRRSSACAIVAMAISQIAAGPACSTRSVGVPRLVWVSSRPRTTGVMSGRPCVCSRGVMPMSNESWPNTWKRPRSGSSSRRLPCCAIRSQRSRRCRRNRSSPRTMSAMPTSSRSPASRANTRSASCPCGVVAASEPRIIFRVPCSQSRARCCRRSSCSTTRCRRRPRRCTRACCSTMRLRSPRR